MMYDAYNTVLFIIAYSHARGIPAPKTQVQCMDMVGDERGLGCSPRRTTVCLSLFSVVPDVRDADLFPRLFRSTTRRCTQRTLPSSKIDRSLIVETHYPGTVRLCSAIAS